MSNYKENLISLVPYGVNAKKYKAKRDSKGRIIVKLKKGKKKDNYKFNEETNVVM